MGMKKVIGLSAVALAVASMFSVAPAQANTKSLVVIDSYFDSRIGNTPIVCVPGNSCTIDTRTRNTSLSHPLNHGVAMVDAVKSKFPQVNVIALRAADATTEMNVGQLVSALEWAVQNKNSISALSLSRKMNGNLHNRTGCDAASINTAHLGGKALADQRVRSLIAELKANNIPVFVSTGNGAGNIVDYPACITDTNSVSTGSPNRQGLPTSVDKFNDTTDYFVSIANNRFSITGTLFPVLPNTTSLATVLAAAKYTAESNLTKFISVLP
ncbi:MAG: hypothetical protein EBS31_00215 [Burkholderiaceae bacterium]|nr:hypothetical protein [Burkholderiaceae bacterium]